MLFLINDIIDYKYKTWSFTVSGIVLEIRLKQERCITGYLLAKTKTMVEIQENV